MCLEHTRASRKLVIIFSHIILSLLEQILFVEFVDTPKHGTHNNLVTKKESSSSLIASYIYE